MSKLFFSLDKSTAKKLSSLYQQKILRRISQGIYTDNLSEAIEKIVNEHWMQIVAYIVSKGILSFRTAFDLKPTAYKPGLNIVFMTSSYAKSINMPGLIIKVYKGNNKDYYEQILPNLAKSNIPRMLLENLTQVKSKDLKSIKIISKTSLEKFLAKELQFRGEERLNQIRDEAKQIAIDLGYQKEYEQLSQIISGLLVTKSISTLESPYAISIAKKEPYDENRLQSFEKLSLYLQQCLFRDRPYSFNKTSFKNISFFESYFSNFIEGTEFTVDEAEDIVFKGEEIYQRHADSHDVLANFYLSNDFLEMNKTPKDFSDFIELLKARHAYLMRERPEILPGEFKNKPNRAGNTYFVDPQFVLGTLRHGFEIYALLKAGLPKALFMHYLISEVHPFNDGNGRTARVMMNAELVSANLFKIIMPTVCRDNYLGALRQATRDHYFSSYCKVMDQAQAYTESIPWADYASARNKIEEDYANKTSDEGLPIFNRVLRNLSLSELK